MNSVVLNIDPSNTHNSESPKWATVRNKFCYIWRWFFLLVHACKYVSIIYSITELFITGETDMAWRTIRIWMTTGLYFTVLGGYQIREQYHDLFKHKRQGILWMILRKTTDPGEGFLHIIKRIIWTVLLLTLSHGILPLRKYMSLSYKQRAHKIQNKRSPMARICKQRMYRENQLIRFLELVEFCSKTAPLFVLQATFWFHKENYTTVSVCWKFFGWILDIVTLGCSMRNIHATARSSNPERKKLSWLGSSFVFAWHLGTVGARVLLITVGACSRPRETMFVSSMVFFGWSNWFFFFSGPYLNKVIRTTLWAYLYDRVRVVGWISDSESTLMYGGLVRKVKSNCLIDERLNYSTISSWIASWAFVIPQGGSTFWRQLAYTVVNLVVNVMYYYGIYTVCLPDSDLSDSKRSILEISLYVCPFLYVVGIMAMLIFYGWCHPTTGWRTCLERLSNYFGKSNTETKHVEHDERKSHSFAADLNDDYLPRDDPPFSYLLLACSAHSFTFALIADLFTE